MRCQIGLIGIGGATSPAVILCSCVGSGALFLIRGRIPVPLSRTWRLFDPSRPTDVRRFSPGLAGARCRGSRAGSLPTDMAPRVRRSARGTVTAAHGVTAAAAARVGAVAVRGMTATARARVVRELTDEAVILIRNVRRHFEREMADTRRILWKKPAERTAVATGVSRRTVSRVSASGAAERTRPAGTPERRKSRRRIPLEEYTRVWAAIYQQYRDKMLPTLDSTLHVLTTCQEGAAGSGAGGCEQSGENFGDER